MKKRVRRERGDEGEKGKEGRRREGSGMSESER